MPDTSLSVGCVEHTLALLEGGLDVNAVDNEGMTPLMVAAMLGNTDLIQILVIIPPLSHSLSFFAAGLEDGSRCQREFEQSRRRNGPGSRRGGGSEGTAIRRKLE